MKKLLLLVFLFKSFSISAQIKLEYIGNMGVLISGNNSSILIDALHKEYDKNAYLFPTQNKVDSLTNQLYKVPPISILLATHNHKDHLDPSQIGTFLEKNPESYFFGSSQSINLIKDFNSNLTDQIIEIESESYSKKTFPIGRLKVTGFKMDHGNPDKFKTVQNIGYIIDIDGKRILHLGDTEWFETAFDTLELSNEEIDIAIVPFWMFPDKESVTKLKKWINPGITIATHFPPVNYEGFVERVKNNYPELYVFIKKGEKIIY